MNKKLLAALSLSCAAIFSCFAFAACGDTEEKPDDTDGAAEEETFEYQVKTWTYTDAKGESATLDYGLYFPDSYSDSGTAFPLITYVPDSGYADKTIDYLADGGECLAHWISADKASTNPAVFLFLTFSSAGAAESDGNEIVGLSDVTVPGSQASQVVEIIDSLVENYNIDANRLYLTGQSMGGILDWSLNTAYPDKFAATVYVGCQPGDNVPDEATGVVDAMYDDIIAKAEFVNQKFVYITSRLDMKAPMGQDDVEAVIKEAGGAEGVTYGKNYNLDPNDIAGCSETLKALFANNYDQYFVAFPQVANGNGGFEHLRSFDPAYSIDAIYEWLLAQSL